MIENFKDLEIVKVKNNLRSQLKSVKANVIYCDSIICEVVVQYGPDPIEYSANKLI